MNNTDGTRTRGIVGLAKAVVIDEVITGAWITTLATDTDLTVTGLDYEDNPVTLTAFTLKMCGGFMFKKITAVSTATTDLILVQ